ncbi:uncharacterized protein N7518_003149 [Penicillium psychrosexuale]|uniref:uncharacterized protein n=1 Tax=Penicillium psychrosexuale TaxID=1002107 RepID=UPI002545A2C7|nr:uncharacterized protein N7518_003149 [Penicillium psychrosexuale]KAJ5801081.1 hypothetical protein N7518_003149 [Penicillium psychrosexuale]
MPTWFRKGISPGTTITLDQPVASKWEVVERLSEADEQLFEADRRRGEKLSYAKNTAQDKSGLIPNGFAVYLVWEMVPGLHLGSRASPDAFWDLDHAEREEIRQNSLRNFSLIRENGYFPDVLTSSDKTGKPKEIFPDVMWIAHFKLAIPNSNFISSGTLSFMRWRDAQRSHDETTSPPIPSNAQFHLAPTVPVKRFTAHVINPRRWEGFESMHGDKGNER